MSDQLALPRKRGQIPPPPAPGMRWCSVDKHWMPIGEFHSDRSKDDRLAKRCRDCHGRLQAERWRRKYADPAWRRRSNDLRNASNARHPERKRARTILGNAIRDGRFPRASTQACVDCGAQATQWDHHLGYAIESALAVEAVCRRCHNLRGRARGEFKPKRDEQDREAA